jgi:hypothetical protein
MSRASDFRGAYSPGGAVFSSPRARARRAGLRSGVVRRRRALRRRGIEPGAGSRRLALDYELRRVSRDEFDARYAACWPRPEHPAAAAQWERGRETVWQHVLACYALLCARGQHCRTTNGQRGTALTARGRPRCRRTLQRYSRKLEQMGLASVLHVRRPPGRKDCLAIEWHVTRRLPCLSPPLRERGTLGSAEGVPRRPASLPPPAAAESGPPDKPAERPVTRREELEAQIRFQQLKLDAGWRSPAIHRTLETLRLALRQVERESSPPERSGADG